MEALPVIKLMIERRSSHPWIYQKMVKKPVIRPAPGTVVDIHDMNDQWVARGFYNGHSRITLRVLTQKQDEPIDEAFFTRRIRQAIALRRDVMKLDEVTNAYRLVHSEGDELSGLVVDRFDQQIVIEYFSAGMWKWRETIQKVLAAEFPGCTFYFFAEEHVQKQESFDCWARETPPAGVITEHGLRFRVQPGSKHKTGFFTDQRDNRLRLASLSQGKKVLDLCCNSGGFAVYAKAKGQAEEVTGVDLDEEVLELAKSNANLNQVRAKFTQADIFPWLRDAIRNNQQYDVVILDPAKQTRDRDEVEDALKRYMDMNRLAMQVVAPGGTFLTCSCTGLVSEEMFMESVRRAAWQAGKTLQIFHVSGGGTDHPFLGHVKESRYLKAIWGRVLHVGPPPPPRVQMGMGNPIG